MSVSIIIHGSLRSPRVHYPHVQTESTEWRQSNVGYTARHRRSTSSKPFLTRSELTGGAGGRVWDMEGCQTGLFLCALGVEEIAQATRGIRIGCVGISRMLVSSLEDPGGT